MNRRLKRVDCFLGLELGTSIAGNQPCRRLFCEEQTIKCQNGAIRDLSYLNIIAFVLSHIDTNSITGAQAGFEHALHW